MVKRLHQVAIANESGEASVQLMTRIPQTLKRAVKLAVIEQDIRLGVFVAEAIREKLAAEAKS